ncbi:MAG: phosphotransferase [Candidatus Nanopelagicales bacterium]
MTPVDPMLDVVRRCGIDAASVRPRRANTDELTAPWLADKYGGGLLGTHPLTVTDAAGVDRDVVCKVRHSPGISVTLMPGVYARLGITLPRPYSGFRAAREMTPVLRREIDVYARQRDVPALAACQPALVGSMVDEDADLSALVVEFVPDAVLMDTGADVSGWTRARVDAQVTAIAAVHGAFLGPPGSPPPGLRSLPAPFSAADVAADRDLWAASAEYVHRVRPDLLDDAGLRRRLRLADTAGDWYGAVAEHPHTLAHDDFNPRNACFRGDGRPLVYDWELASWGTPLRDLVEMLTFTVTPDWGDDDIRGLVRRHRSWVERAGDVRLDPQEWDEAFRGEVMDEALNRLAFQQVLGQDMPLGYVERITAAVDRLLDLVSA